MKLGYVEKPKHNPVQSYGRILLSQGLLPVLHISQFQGFCFPFFLFHLLLHQLFFSIINDIFVPAYAEGVGELMKMAVERGRKGNRNLEIGICGEQGGDPEIQGARIYRLHSPSVFFAKLSRIQRTNEDGRGKRKKGKQKP